MRPGSRRRRDFGRRRRRLQRAAAALALVAVAAVAVVLLRRSRPEVRRPGERLDEITDNLAAEAAEGTPTPDLRDVTREAGLAEVATFIGRRSSQLPEDMGSGVAWGDWDRDGDDDLFVVAAGGPLVSPRESWAPSQLYENLGDGTFAASSAFAPTRLVGMAAAWGDADGDGWLDLVVTGYRSLELYHSEEGRLVPTGALAPSDSYWSGASWGDFDGDGDLDLYVCGYVAYEEPDEGERRVSQQYGAAVPYTLNPASFEPLPNLLFQNRGDGTFEEVALLYGVSNPEGRSLGALWHDFDQDGRLDLYVANDISDNALYLNRGDTFEEVGLAALVADYRGAMGLAAGDWDRDGDDDLFITHWVAQENALYDSQLVDRGGPGSGARLVFSDVSARLGLGAIALPVVGWGTEFADLDADGWLDLVVVNGSTLEDKKNPQALEAQRPFLFWNRRGERYDDLAPANEALAEPHVGRGMAVSDYDGDGDLDLVVVHYGEGIQLLENDMTQGNWIQLDLRQRAGDGHRCCGEGATVVARAGELALRRSVTGGSYLSQSSSIVHVGLGAVDTVDEVTVSWSDGHTDAWGPLAGHRRWQLLEGEAEPRLLAARAAPLSREALARFWELQRAGMDAMKRDDDPARAIELFREALALDPGHEDSRYYLANCLATLGEPEAALEELALLRRQSSMSHRANRQWAVLRARLARSQADLDAAEVAAQRALELNREETGSLLLLGELALMRGELDEADERLALATRTNPRAVGGFFLRAHVAHRRGDRDAALELLESARAALGPEWKPEGAAAEGDTTGRHHDDATPLSPFWDHWSGEADPDTAFVALDEELTAIARLPVS